MADNEIKIELEVTRLDLVYKRRRYVIEKRWSDGGGGMFIYRGHRLIYSTWNKEVNTPEGVDVEEAYLAYKNDERAKITDPTHWS